MFALAALAVAARLPFLISGKIPFDSDEAVEGLMARHLLNGELPAFLWGQAFKGVPEVYLAAGAFSAFGSSVGVLKGVTLALFAAFVALQFVLLDKIASRWVAVAASALLIAAPPTLVFWSLDASAEYVWVMLLGTTLVLLASGRTRRPAAAGFLVGLGLWVHQLILVYLIPLAVQLVAGSEWWRRRDFGKPRAAALVLGAIAVFYLALAAVAFTTGGFALDVGGIEMGVRAPQKMARIAAAVAGLALVVHLLATTTRAGIRQFAQAHWPAAAGFLVGYLPAILYSLLVEPARSPARNANLRQLVEAAPDILGNIVPIVAGFKMATTERLAIPLVAALPGAAALAAYVWSTRRALATSFFPLFVVWVPFLFIAGGAYLDTQSYRYLVPWYAGLAVAWSGGSLALAGGRRTIATVIVASIVLVHGWQQVVWYRRLQPDVQSPALIECLTRNGIRGGYAEYWTSYKLTFLAGEAIIIAPSDGVDRYPRYTDFVRSLPPEERLEDASLCDATRASPESGRKVR